VVFGNFTNAHKNARFFYLFLLPPHGSQDPQERLHLIRKRQLWSYKQIRRLWTRRSYT